MKRFLLKYRTYCLTPKTRPKFVYQALHRDERYQWNHIKSCCYQISQTIDIYLAYWSVQKFKPVTFPPSAHLVFSFLQACLVLFSVDNNCTLISKRTQLNAKYSQQHAKSYPQKGNAFDLQGLETITKSGEPLQKCSRYVLIGSSFLEEGMF